MPFNMDEYFARPPDEPQVVTCYRGTVEEVAEPDRPTVCDCGECRSMRAEEHSSEFEEEDDSDETEYARNADEAMLPGALASALPTPLLRILRQGGRRWSAEVEINALDYSQAARVLRAETAGYNSEEDGSNRNGSVFSTPDCTVDAEIKLSRMRDGNARHAQTCVDTYRALRDAGGVVGYNCGHHVHVDAQRLAELGTDAAVEVIGTAAMIGKACDATLTALAATGFDRHRQEMGNEYGEAYWRTDAGVLEDRSALHGSRTGYAINYNNASTATVEYRLPNGTLEPIRAHAHVAVALGLVDLAEAAILDHDKRAVEAVQAARGQAFGEHEGMGFLMRHLRLHADSYVALGVAAETSPMGRESLKIVREKARRVTGKTLARA